MLLSLETRGFRNLAEQTWEPGPGHHLLLGSNGAGKTSLLEALYLLATTRSFRTAQLADCCQRGADGFEIHGVVRGERRTELCLGWRRGAGNQRSRDVDGNGTSLADHLSVLPVLAWTASDHELLTGPPVLRRRLLDRGVVAIRPSSIAVLARYRQSLAAKRALLARGAHPRMPELISWNEVLATEAHRLSSARAAYAGRLKTALAGVLASCPLDLPPLEVDYRPSLPEALDSRESAAEALAKAAGRECDAKRALRGPHRDDLDLSWQGLRVRRLASAGERKALGLLLLVAQAQVLTAAGKPPVVLIDDADAELDRDRLGRVWAAMGDVSQVLATSNRPEVWGRIEPPRRWLVEAGNVMLEAAGEGR